MTKEFHFQNENIVYYKKFIIFINYKRKNNEIISKDAKKGLNII